MSAICLLLTRAYIQQLAHDLIITVECMKINVFIVVVASY